MKQLKYQIGDGVIVIRRQYREVSGCVVRWRPNHFSINTYGQVVGITYKYDGEIKRPDWDGGHFVPSKGHRFWLVRLSLRGKPICVAEEDMRLARLDEVKELPYQYLAPMCDSLRKALSDDSKDWPRDARGRWIKETI